MLYRGNNQGKKEKLERQIVLKNMVFFLSPVFSGERPLQKKAGRELMRGSTEATPFSS